MRWPLGVSRDSRRVSVVVMSCSLGSEPTGRRTDRDAERPPVGGRGECVLRQVVRPVRRATTGSIGSSARVHSGTASRLRHMSSAPGSCAGTASVVFDPTLTDYDFGPQHPMSPVRVDLTMRLAEELGVLKGLRTVPAPMADDDLIATVHDPALIEAVTRMGERPGPGEEGRGLGTDDNPVFVGMHHAAAHVVGASVEAFRQVWSGECAAQRQHRRRPAPRDARPGQRLLHLQRRRDRDPVAARPGRRAGRLRRRRRAPRRRRRADLLGRPAGAHHLPARVRPVPLPRHRVRRGHRRSRGARVRRSTSPCRPAPATPAGCGRSTRSCRRWCASSRPRSWSPSTAATRTPTTRWPTCS